jgi:hypothetical protein
MPLSANISARTHARLSLARGRDVWRRYYPHGVQCRAASPPGCRGRRDPSARRRLRAAGVLEDGGAAAAAGGCRGAGEVQQDVRPR